MKSLLLDYARVPGHSNLFLEFLQSDSLQGFYGPYPRGCSGLQVLAAERRRMEFPRAEISKALRDFNRKINNSAAAAANAARLADDGVLGVVAGQHTARTSRRPNAPIYDYAS